MTHLIIHPKIADRNQYLLNLVNQLLEKEYSTLSQLFTIPDLHIVDNTASKSIGIDEVKQLVKEMIYHPLEQKYQIGIIFHSQNLTTEAQNALLKSLEEQPEQSQYILLVNNEKNLLDTIVSRCTRHYVKSAKTTPEEDAQANETLPIPEILTLDLPAQFEYIAKLDEQNKEEPSTIEDFLTTLLEYYRQNLQITLEQQKMQKAVEISSAIKKIDLANIRIHANTGKKTTLENLVLQLNRIKL